MKLPSVVSKPRANADWVFADLDVSETTRKDYSARVGLFISYVHQHGFDQHTLLAFKRHLERNQHYSVSTKNKYLASAQVFLKELVRRGMLPIGAMQSVRFFRQSKRHRREGFTDREVRLIAVKLKYLPDTPRNTRLRAIFSLLAFQGLRQIELVRLDVEDVDLRRKTALVRGKGRDDKELIYLAPATVSALREYVRMHKLTAGTLFRSMGNRKAERLSTMTIKREIGGLCKELGMGKGVHGFRHFYITELLKTMGMRDVQKLSRHRSLEMLMVYDDETLVQEKAQQAFKVMDRFSFAP